MIGMGNLMTIPRDIVPVVFGRAISSGTVSMTLFTVQDLVVHWLARAPIQRSVHAGISCTSRFKLTTGS
jgi:hypothetical protein